MRFKDMLTKLIDRRTQPTANKNSEKYIETYVDKRGNNLNNNFSNQINSNNNPPFADLESNKEDEFNQINIIDKRNNSENNIENISNTGVYVVDLDTIDDITGVKPSSIKIKYYDTEIDNIPTWRAMYRNLFKLIYDDFKYSNIDFSVFTRKNPISGYKISDDLIIETHFSTADILKLTRKLINYCGMNYSHITITYRLAEQVHYEVYNKNEYASDKATPITIESKVACSNKGLIINKELLMSFVQEYFPNGIIDLSKSFELNSILNKFIYTNNLDTSPDIFIDQLKIISQECNGNLYTPGVYVVDWNSMDNITGIKPNSIKIKYFDIEIDNIPTWRDMYRNLFKLIYDDFQYSNIDFSIFTRKNPISGYKVSDDLIIETHFSTADILKLTRKLIDLCVLKYSHITITYRLDGQVNYEVYKEKEYASDKTTPITIESKVACSNKVLVINRELLMSFVQEYFPDGIIDLSKKFKLNRTLNKFIDTHNLDTSPDIFIDQLKIISQECNGNLYFSDIILTDQDKQAIKAYIEQEFNVGNKSILYKTIYESFPLDSGYLQKVNNWETLQIILPKTFETEYNFQVQEICSLDIQSMDREQEVINLLLKGNMKLTIEDIIKKLPFREQEKNIRSIFSRTREIINDGEGYFHIKTLELHPDKLEKLTNLIETNIKKPPFYITREDLITEIKYAYPEIMDLLEISTPLGIYNSLKYYFHDKFKFKGSIITLLGKNIDRHQLFIDLIKKCTTKLTINEIEALRNELNTQIPFDDLYKYGLRINETEFVNKSQADFNIEATDKTLDEFIKSDYLPTQAIDSFITFPEAGYSWNGFLLENYVMVYSKKFKLLYKNLNKSSLSSIIVRKSSNINDFEQLLVRALADSTLDLNKQQECLQYLKSMGYIARETHRAIGQIMLKAKNLRGQIRKE